MGVSASDTHSRKNVGLDTAEATRRIVAMAKRAVEAGRAVQVSVQSAFGCGFEGPVPEERVLSIVREYVGAGLTRISLADTAGHAWPDQVERLYGRLLALAPDAEPACHFHDTYGLGMANVWAAMRAGAVSFESSFGGLGGCPFSTSIRISRPTRCRRAFTVKVRTSWDSLSDLPLWMIGPIDCA